MSVTYDGTEANDGGEAYEWHHTSPLLDSLSQTPRIALVGNPNCGKTTAFNQYTGTHQHVANYPGVTVESKEGFSRLDDARVLLLDLPGTYSLTAYSQEEIVTREALLPKDDKERPQAVIDVVDASTLERGMFLTVQILEMGLPVVLACNMMDEVRKAGTVIDMNLLSRRLGIPVFPVVARKGEGLDAALRAAVAAGQGEAMEPLHISYGSDLNPVLMEMEKKIVHANALLDRYPPRWTAVKVLEGDEALVAELGAYDAALLESLSAMRDTLSRHLEATLRIAPEAVITDYRYAYIRGVLRDGVVRKDNTKDRLAMTDKLDSVFTNALAGPLIMLGVMYAMFYTTFELGAYPQGWLEAFFGWLGTVVGNILPDGLLKSLLVNGIIDGVGGVLSFVPLIMIMFLLIAFLDDSGYMARMAYMLDRVFRMFGLHGASVMPYIVSGGIAGGCAIPGVMATRTLRSPKEKLATLLTLPFMACGAKLPVFLLLVGVFFQENKALVMFSLMLAGWAAALLVSRLLRSTIIRGDATPFVMELPPYRLPSLRSVLIHCWERTWMYIKKAGTVLLAISVLLWAAMTFPELDEEKARPFETEIAMLEEQIRLLPADADEAARSDLASSLEEKQAALASEELRYSFAGRLGTFVEPVTLPAGFDWRTDIALISGIAAKEAIVSTLGTAYSLGEQDPEEATGLAERLAKDPAWSKAVALALMLFVLLYSPCFVALVVIRQEAGSWKWLAFSVIFNTVLAYGVAVAAYRIGSLVWG